MKRVLFFIFLISSFTTKSQTIISDTVLDINCYHEGAIYTKVASLDSNVYTKWYYSQDTSFWNFLDTASFGVYLNNSNLKNGYARALCFRLFENNGIIKRERNQSD